MEMCVLGGGAAEAAVDAAAAGAAEAVGAAGAAEEAGAAEAAEEVKAVKKTTQNAHNQKLLRNHVIHNKNKYM